jgi:hypothetical protein
VPDGHVVHYCGIVTLRQLAMRVPQNFPDLSIVQVPSRLDQRISKPAKTCITGKKGRFDDDAGFTQGDRRSTPGGREVSCAGVRPGNRTPPLPVSDGLRVDVDRT